MGQKEVAALFRILVVDDEQAVASHWSMFLARAGFETKAAYDARGAIAAASEFRPHLALLDLNLPGMDGHELGRHLREINPGIALVAVTGDDTLRANARSEALGFTAHLIKPVRLEDMRRMIQVVITSL